MVIGGMLQILGSKQVEQNGPTIEVQCQIGWSGTNEYDTFYNLSSTPQNYSVSPIMNYNIMLEKNQFYFYFSHNEGENKDPIFVVLILEIEGDEVNLVAFNIDSDYSLREESNLRETLPYVITGTGQDDKSDWQDSWRIDIFTYSADVNKDLSDSGQSMYVVGFIFLSLSTLISMSILLVFIIQNVLISLSRKRGDSNVPPEDQDKKWYEDKKDLSSVVASFANITLYVIQFIVQK